MKVVSDSGFGGSRPPGAMEKQAAEGAYIFLFRFVIPSGARERAVEGSRGWTEQRRRKEIKRDPSTAPLRGSAREDK